MLKVIIGYNKHRKIKSATLLHYPTDEDIKNDVMDMLKSGLTVNVVEMDKCVIGARIDWSKTKIVKL